MILWGIHMKKLISIVVAFAVLFSTAAVSFAAGTSSLTSIKYSKSGNQDKISLYTVNYKGYNAFWMKNPDRLVIDIPNSKLAIKGSQTININSQYVSKVRFSQFSKTAVRVVFDTKGKVPYTVKALTGNLAFVLGSSDPANRGNGDDRPPVSTTPPASTPDTPTTPTTPTAPTTPSTPATPSTPTTPDAPVTPSLPLQQLSFSSQNGSDVITIPGGNHDGYNVFRLTDPDRVVIDVPNLLLSADQQLLNINSSLINTIRTSPVDSTTTRIVMDTKGQPLYLLDKTADSMKITLAQPTLKNLAYHNAGDRVYLSINGTNLTKVSDTASVTNSEVLSTEGSGDQVLLYSGSYDASGASYTITFPSNLADIGTGALQINDGVMNFISVSNNLANQTTSITFNAKSGYMYKASFDQNANSTEMSILEPQNPDEKLVVIDAGHGGSDPGAQYAGVNEKDLNLKIALKVNEILKSKNIKTYMTRVDDTFIPLHDRADMANNLNATLFLSIHNNAYNKSEHGTETLYYPGSAGKNYAQVVQDSLVSALGTYDRGIVQRPNLVVLNSTKMPAVIAEVAFITNDGDRANLQNDDFIQKAAQALADAVIKMLNE